MNKKLIVILAAFALVLGGAYMLYSQLSEELAPDQLAVQTEAPAQTGGDASEDPSAAETTEPQPAAPDFTVYDKEGNAVQLSDYFGKPIVLNFWASWCGPCKSEMPEFNKKYLELQEEVTFLMVNMTTSSMETKEAGMEYVESHGFSFPVLYDLDSDAAVTYQVYSLPTTYFLNAEGQLIAQATGAINAETLMRGIDMVR